LRRPLSGGVGWVEQDANTPTPYLLGAHRTANGRTLSVALARPTRMGGPATPGTASATPRAKILKTTPCKVATGVNHPGWVGGHGCPGAASGPASDNKC